MSKKLLSLLASLFAVSVAQAAVVNLADGNSTAAIDLSSQAGMYSWTVNDQPQLVQQWFWYRLGNDPTGQHSIDTIGGLTESHNANSLTASYNSGSFTLELTYQLSGGAVGGNDWTSDITETISIINNTASALDFHFFQYSDFALAGTQGGETATIYQSGGFFSKADVIKGMNQVSESIAIDQPLADHAEANTAPNTLNSLNQGSPYTLNDILSAGPDAFADSTWALEWDFQIDPNGSVEVLKDKKISVAPIPEPGALGLLALGMGALALRRARWVS